jgi:lysophospholipase
MNVSHKGNMSNIEPYACPLPPGGQTLRFKARDGWLLRGMIWRPESATATVLLLNGRGDFIEKYAELVGDLVANGYAVATLDWRGQGLSGQMTAPPRRTHVKDFALWVDDAKFWLESIVSVHCPAPYKLLGHSMGGHLGLRIMHDLPGKIEKAVLLVPMLELQVRLFSSKFIRFTAKIVAALGLGARFAFGQNPYSANVHSSSRMNRLTSDSVRFAQEEAAIKANPALAIGGVSFDWLVAAFKSADLLMSPGYAESIVTPTLVFSAEREMLINNSTNEDFVRRMPHSIYEVIADGRHELLRERDEIRQYVLVKILKFFQSPSV